MKKTHLKFMETKKYIRASVTVKSVTAFLHRK